MTTLTKIIITTTLLTLCSLGLSNDILNKKNTTPHAMSGSFISIATTKNDPVIHSKNTIDGRHVTYLISYHKLLANHWFMGLGANFKSFTDKDQNDELSFISIQHEACYTLRLSRYNYLFIGPTLLYIMPTQRSYFPVLKDPEVSTEIGAGAMLGIGSMITQDYFVSLSLHRWRGTKTDKFHAFETALSLKYRFKD